VGFHQKQLTMFRKLLMQLRLACGWCCCCAKFSKRWLKQHKIWI